MDILTGLNAVNAVLRGTQGLVRELKKPTASDVAFAQILQQQLNAAGGSAGSGSGESMRAIERGVQQFITQRDTNGDGLLTKDESGLNSDFFQKLDQNGDGKLSLAEIRTEALARMSANAQRVKQT